MAFDYEVLPTNIKGIYEVIPSHFSDHRGKIWSGMTENLEAVLNVGNFHHQKFARNKKNVLRGFHGDFETYKLVSCLYGDIQQVAVDYRPQSATYKKSISWVLTGQETKMILLPPGIGNAFKTLSDVSVYAYSLCYDKDYNDFDKQFTVRFDDPTIQVNWLGGEPILSKRDSL